MQRNVRQSGRDEGRFTAQLSSGQLVIAICVSLFIMLACFLLGVLAGKYDGTLTDAVSTAAAAMQQEDKPSATPEPSKPDRPKAGQQSPRTPEETPTLAMRRPATERTVVPPPAEAPRRVELAPLPASPSPAVTSTQDSAPPHTPPVFEETRPPEIIGASTAPARESAPVPTRVPAEPAPAPAPNPARVEIEPLAPAPEISAPATGTPPAGAAPVLQPSDPGSYGVQMISLWGGNRAQRARDVQQKLQKEHKLSSTVLIQQNGERYVVVVTGYQTEAEAQRARDKLRTETEYADCFVRSL